MKTIYIYGASGYGLVVEDIAKFYGYEETIFIDDGENNFKSFEEIKHNVNIPIAFGIGSNNIRQLLYKKVKETGFSVKTLIHPSAVIASNVSIGEGSIVMANSVINAQSNIGKCCIINTSSVIEHENKIGNFVHISPNSALAGNVSVGQNTHIGIGSSIIQGINIGEETIIGAGSVVVKNIPSYVKAYGNPCKIIEG